MIESPRPAAGTPGDKEERARKREAERREAAARRREGVDAAAPEEVRLRPKKLTPWLPAGRARDFDEM